LAYRIIFWCPRNGVDVWRPAKQPLGEAIREVVLRGNHSELLEPFPAEEMLLYLATAFPQSRTNETGKLQWNNELDNGFVALAGPQFVEMVSFDLADEDLDKIFTIAERFGCQHYDWGS